MPPKKKASNRWFADHKAAWITGGCAVAAAIVAATLKFSAPATQTNNFPGVNNGQVFPSAGNQSQIYAPQQNTYNNYYAPNSNSVTKEAIEALESKLATATNKIELTVGEVQKLAQALRDLDQRTSGIEKLPDGRTRFGDIVAGTPKALLEVAARAEKNYQAGDFQNALKEYQEVIKFFATVPDDVYSVRDSLPPATKSFYYQLAGDCAMRLKDFSTALEYAKKADELQAGLRSKLLLTSIYGNMAEAKYNQRNLAEAFPLYKQAIDLYEPLVNFVHTQGSMVGVIRGTNSAGKLVTTVYNSNDELYSAEAAAGLYAEAAFSAFMTGHQTESLDYLQKATDLAPTNSFVLAVAKVVRPATDVAPPASNPVKSAGDTSK